MIELAGETLSYETAQITDHFDRYLRYAGANITAPPVPSDLAINYPEPHPPAINELYWPTGAARWGRFYGLATEAVKNKLEQAAKDKRGGASNLLSTALQLKLGPKAEFSLDMYMLPPRPLAPVKNTLWIIPLVDYRYWWQFLDVGNLAITTSSTWATLISSIASIISITPVYEAVSSDYLIPNPHGPHLNSDYAKLPALFDAVAHSIGTRVVCNLDGTIELMRWDRSQEVLDENLTKAKIIAGGSFRESYGQAPGSVRVTFPQAKHFIPTIDGSAYKYDVTPSALLFDSPYKVAGTFAEIRSTAYADFTDGGGTPDNDTALQALADKIGADYYDGLARQYDYAISRLFNWQPCGYDDFVSWNFGRRRRSEDGGGLDVLVRVRSTPHGLQSPLMLHQDSSLTIWDELEKIGAADGDIASGATDGTVTVSGVSLENVRLTHAEGGEQVSDTKEVFVRYYRSLGYWLIVGAECED